MDFYGFLLFSNNASGVKAIFCFLLLSALTAFGTFVTVTVYSLSESVSDGVKQCMLLLAAWPAMEGMVRHAVKQIRHLLTVLTIFGAEEMVGESG